MQASLCAKTNEEGREGRRLNAKGESEKVQVNSKHL